MNAAKAELETRLPHRRTMLLLDELVDADASRAVCLVRITPESGFFIPPAGIPAWVGIEYMAQTVAVIGGTRAMQAGDAAPEGFLLGTRKYRCSASHFPAGAELRIEARELAFDSNGIGAYNCRIEAGEIEAEARLTIFQKVTDPVSAR